MQHPLYTPDCILGYSTDWHMLLDLDKIDLWRAQRITASLIKDQPWLGCGLVLQSSASGFHVVFDEPAEWDRLLSLTDLLSELHIVNRQYRTLRHWRGDLTLRISPKVGSKSIAEVPTAKCYVHSAVKCCHAHGIATYLECLRAYTIAEKGWDGLGSKAKPNR